MRGSSAFGVAAPSIKANQRRTRPSPGDFRVTPFCAPRILSACVSPRRCERHTGTCRQYDSRTASIEVPPVRKSYWALPPRTHEGLASNVRTRPGQQKGCRPIAGSLFQASVQVQSEKNRPRSGPQRQGEQLCHHLPPMLRSQLQPESDKVKRPSPSEPPWVRLLKRNPRRAEKISHGRRYPTTP